MTFKPIETQEDFDNAVSERLKRKENAVRDEYSDYEALKAKADKLDAVTKNGEIDIDAEMKRLGEFEKAAEENKAKNLREKVAKDAGVPAELVFGTTEDEMKANADAIAKFAKPETAPKVPNAGSHSGSSEAPSDSLKSFVKELLPKE